MPSRKQPAITTAPTGIEMLRAPRKRAITARPAIHENSSSEPTGTSMPPIHVTMSTAAPAIRNEAPTA